MSPKLSLKYLAMFPLLVTLSLVAATPAKSTGTVRLIDTLSSGSSQPGDRFTATLEAPLVVNDRVVAEPGTRVIGEVVDVVSSGRLQRPALITLRLLAVDEGRSSVPLHAGELTIKADSHAKRNLVVIGGAAALGSLIGASEAGARGAAIGGLIGAGVGVTGAYLTGKREIVLPSETVLSFHVTSALIHPHELAELQRRGRTSDYDPRLRERSECESDRHENHQHYESENGHHHGEHEDDDCERHRGHEDYE